MKRRMLAVMGLLAIASCSIPADTSRVIEEDPTVLAARSAMVGMSEADVRMCAGFPTNGVALSDNEKIWTYQRTYSRGSVNVGVTSLALGPMPGMSTTTGVGTDGFCNTQIRFVDGKVSQVEFAGDNNTVRHINGLCVSTIDRCVVYAHSQKGADPIAPQPQSHATQEPSARREQPAP